MNRAMDGIAAWEQRWRPFERDQSLALDVDLAARAIDELVERLHDNYPFFHPDYAGQMLKPPHPVALAAYLAAARINPNNHALDGGPATAALEREVVAQIAAMFGYHEHLGHLTSSGTIANLEALWVASRLAPGKVIAFSAEAHYTHARMCALLGVETSVIPVDARGRLDVAALLDSPDVARIGAVVVTAGTTATGAVDPIHEIVPVARERSWRVHCDAAYGGFFSLLASEPEARMDPAPWRAIASCDSVVVDPHKHGLQPYGCGCVIFRDPAVGALYKHDSPYTYFSSNELHLGEISLECSRAGAAAAALWVTLRCLPLLPSEGLGAVLLRCRRAALGATSAARKGLALVPVVEPELDIVTLAPGPLAGVKASVVSQRSEQLFERAASDPQEPVYLAKWRVPKTFGRLAMPGLIWDGEDCTVLRSVLMKPEHEQSAAAVIARLERLSSL
ncbi:MAG TPA: aminotransferase class I/II-fold pyridoxal phosphate-dependent enzyme [Candidatus Tumulicola sp.]|nr:aminotransferase class I/II-fold pyridoxal phosphate-dependent enzyme [Candidatus Tumulicola sp.]